MKILVHQNAKTPVKVISSGDEKVMLTSKTCTGALWELAEKFPEEIIGWCEEGVEPDLTINNWDWIFHHNLIMASYAVNKTFLPEAIGYVDPMPFINVDKSVSYGTWLMSSDVGGIKGKVLLKFRQLFKKEKSFDYLLNSVAKIGQENGLFCYSEPGLVRPLENGSLKTTAGKDELFRFVYQHYTSAWTSVLLLCFFVYEKSFPLLSYKKSFFYSKFFRTSIDLSGLMDTSRKNNSISENVDVIIPTMGRAKYLYDVLKDFSVQTHLPKKIIIVEQNSDPDSASELDFLKEEKWPFKIVHHFIHRTGACNARNLALTGTDAEWVFFSDDDQRFAPNLIETIFKEVRKYGVDGITTSYLQPEENKKFNVPKQWGTFGAGNSVVRQKFVQKVNFLPAFEHGYGEDGDFGRQLRQAGCDIIYHPDITIRHLKAPIGGFREKPALEWEREDPLPKPSPTVMVYALRNYTLQQRRGYKVSLFMKYYRRQGVKNPVTYIFIMNKRWQKSMVWGEELMKRGQTD